MSEVEKAAKTAAVQVAKERDKKSLNGHVTLSTGVKGKIVPVATALLQRVSNKVPLPEVPTWENPDKGRQEPNPNDPKYRRELEEASRARGEAYLDALIMFGLELPDGVPDGNEWIKKLHYMERLGHLDLDGFDLDDPMDREFVYKRYIAVGDNDWVLIRQASNMIQEEVEAEIANFPGQEE